MSIRSTLAKTAGKATKTILEKTRSGGSSMPGKVALKLDPNILATLAKDYRTVIVTGTNGKTLTTSLSRRSSRKNTARSSPIPPAPISCRASFPASSARQSRRSGQNMPSSKSMKPPSSM